MLFHLFSLTFALFSLTSQIDAKTIHALLAADTISDVQIATSKDIKNIKSELELIAQATSASLHIKILHGSHLTKERFYEWAHHTSVAPDDSIFFYYTGHGLRTNNNQTVWPSLFFPPKKELLDFHEIIHLISMKKASLTIVLADCCNNFVKSPPHPFHWNAHPFAKSPYNESAQKNYKKLFLHTKGLIVASSATPGKKSFCTKRGSIFTNAFIYSLKSELEESTPRWERLMKKSKSFCLHLQKPQFHLNIEGD